MSIRFLAFKFFTAAFIGLGFFGLQPIVATSTVESAGLIYREFQGVPFIKITTPIFPKEQYAAHLKNCEDELLDAQRLLIRKGVDVLLEVQGCRYSLESLSEGRFEAKIYFLH